MEFPFRSLAAFVSGFCATYVLWSLFAIYFLAWYETKWSPSANLLLEVGGLAVVAPVAAFSFAVGAYLVNSEQDPWLRALLGSPLVAAMFVTLGYLTANLPDALALATTWGVVLLGPAAVGVWARRSSHSQRTLA